ncbi:Hypothetical protein, putative [Bodo saltans]|uniref:Uncharacterized protein n=1 Tax=Bodo saltans TaxID=75058 RepID=A0A0S4JT84_BODSA|nr:Hypothetical protein, putative [Bodo saltans]|eukprot:CUG93412.1 Hypothetical protein, putative [Bodo saltans]
MNFNLLTDAVLALYDDAELLARDDIIAKSLDTFQGSMATFSRCVENCGANTHDPVSAACNILIRLFESTVEREASLKVEPFALDEVAVVLRETEHLARTVTSSCDLALESISVAATRCGIPSRMQPASILSDNNSVTDMAQTARDRIARLNEALGLFLKDAVRLFDVRVVASVEIEKKLVTCLSQWQSFSPSQQQQISQCVAAELQCRLEWKWFSSFSKDLRSSGASDDTCFLRYEQEWLKNWNRRREALQDQFALSADSVLAAARVAIAKFPSDDVSHEATFILGFDVRNHSDSELRFVKLRQGNRLDSPQSSVSQRQAIRRPRENLRRALEYSSPSPLLTVVSVAPDCDPPMPAQQNSLKVLRRPSSRPSQKNPGDPSPLVVRRIN